MFYSGLIEGKQDTQSPGIWMTFSPHTTYNGCVTESCRQFMTLVKRWVYWCLRKKESATQVIEFLGLLIDTLLMSIWVPPAKQKDILQHIWSVLGNQTVAAANLQSLAGKLNFLVKAFPLGCPFVCQLYNSAAGKHPCRQVQVSEDIKKDLQLWGAFLVQFRGWLPILNSVQANKLPWWSTQMHQPTSPWGGVYTSPVMDGGSTASGMHTLW